MIYQWPPDIDECEQMTSGCQHSCTNTIGSFKCMCDRGYTLSADGFSCEGIAPEFLTSLLYILQCYYHTAN